MDGSKNILLFTYHLDLFDTQAIPCLSGSHRRVKNIGVMICDQSDTPQRIQSFPTVLVSSAQSLGIAC